MGRFDSTKTRVAPNFDALFARDRTGASWLDLLVGLGSRRGVVSTVMSNLRLVEGHVRFWGESEAALPAPQLLLEYLVQHLDLALVQASRDTGEALARRSDWPDGTSQPSPLRLKRFVPGSEERNGLCWRVNLGQMHCLRLKMLLYA